MIATIRKPSLVYSLRDYQQSLVDEVFTQWRQHRKVMLQLATGGGKTICLAAIANHFTSKGQQVLVIAHRQELLWQGKEKLEAITGQPCGIIKAGIKPSPLFPIQMGSIQTLVRRELPPAALVIFDEAHHCAASGYRQILDQYPEALILGVTATPVRTDGRGFEDIFDVLLCGVPISQLICQGHLSKYKIFASAKPIVVNAADVSNTAGDYDQQQLAESMDMQLIFGDLLEEWQKHALGKKTLVFAVSVAHSETIAELYRDQGIPAEHLDGTTPRQEREDILQRFRTDETLILCNCSIVSEGFDLPSVEVVQCVRPTQSLTLWLQLLGRALRPAPGKEYAIILDHTQNWMAHSLPDDERVWSLKGVEAQGGLLIQCSNCDHVYRPISQTEPISYCPNCGFANEVEVLGELGYDEQEEKERQGKHLVEGELVEIDTSIDPEAIRYLDELADIKKVKNYQPYWLYKRFLNRFKSPSIKELQHCASLCGYKTAWGWHRYVEIQEDRRVRELASKGKS